MDMFEFQSKYNTTLPQLLGKWYHFIGETGASAITQHWPLMGAPWFFIHYSIIFLYVFVFAFLGPRIMRDRQPFELKTVIKYYNLFQVCMNSWLVYLFIKGGWFNGYSFQCEPLKNDEVTSQLYMMGSATYWFFISKYIDFLDTLFFVMRKKYNQVSLLHLGHHGSMPVMCWYGARYLSNGHLTLIGLLNSSIHVVMYGYYYLAALGPQWQKYLWWKKYLTIIQMAQFVVLFFHQIQLFFIPCDYPAYPRYWAFFFGPLIFVFFFMFYRETYTPSKKKEKYEFKKPQISISFQINQKNSNKRR